MKLIIFALLCTVALAEKARYDNYRVYQVQVENEQQLELMNYIESNPEGYQFWHGPTEIGKYVELVVPPHKFGEFSEIVETYELQSRKMISNLQEVFDKEDNMRRGKAGGWTSYWTNAEINEFMDGLVQQYPQYVTPINIGQSHEGRDIKGVKVNIGGGVKKAVVLEGTFHAREWISAATTTWILNELLTSSDPEIQTIARDFEWHIVPVSNPDGFVYTHTTDRNWRKNRRRMNVLCVGTDLNRNWDNHHAEGGASTNPCSDTYAGPSPFSEPETLQFSNYLKTLDNRILGYYSFHAYGQMIMTPYGWTKNLPSDHDVMMAIGQAGKSALESKYGTEYALGSIANVIYVASGSSADWVHAELNPGFAFAYEFRDTGRFGFSLPADQIIPNSIEIFASVVAMLKEAKNRGMA